MNEYDSGRIRDLLKPFGYQITDVVDDADMVVLNTCNIREKATEKAYSELGRIKKLKANKDVVVVVAGCVAQAEGEEIFKNAPWVDIVVGPQSYQTLPELLARLARKDRHVWNLDFVSESKFDELPESNEPQGPVAMVTIQEGCDKFCKFCCVPYTRGAEFSRPLEQIYREVATAVRLGSREITLLGQNVNAYHGKNSVGDSITLAQLIECLAEMEGLDRIRYTTSHPVDMTDDLIEAHGKISKLMPMLHLPVQSGSNKVLRNMNRKHTREYYLETISKLRAVQPEIEFSSDFIVGYPGETEADFLDTMELVRSVKYIHSYSFKFSPRPGTPASMMEQIDEDIKDERLQRLQALILSQQKEFNASFLGRTLDVLIDKKGRNEGQFTGRSQYMQSVVVENGQEYFGQVVPVKIDRVYNNSLGGGLCLQQFVH
jgi:tRNA-2-methylthio-N6-dimethylallyladenosine synthase